MEPFTSADSSRRPSRPPSERLDSIETEILKHAAVAPSETEASGGSEGQGEPRPASPRPLACEPYH